MWQLEQNKNELDHRREVHSKENQKRKCHPKENFIKKESPKENCSFKGE